MTPGKTFKALNPVGSRTAIMTSRARIRTRTLLPIGAGLGTAGQRREIEPRHYLGGRAGRGDPSLRQNYQRGSQPSHLGDRVADIDDRDTRLIAQPLNVGQDLGLTVFVERGQRLVHQQQPGAGEQGATDGDALLLATGKQSRPATQQVPDAEHVDHLGEVAMTLQRPGEPPAVEQVLPHGQVREQTAFLEDIGGSAAMPRHKYIAVGVGEDLVSDHNPGVIGTDEAGNRVDQRGLAGARAAEQRREPAITRKIRVQSEVAETVADPNLEHQSPMTLRVASRASSSETRSAAIDIAIETRVRRSAPRSPPGVWVKV